MGAPSSEGQPPLDGDTASSARGTAPVLLGTTPSTEGQPLTDMRPPIPTLTPFRLPR
jgi:hypothetical protein